MKGHLVNLGSIFFALLLFVPIPVSAAEEEEVNNGQDITKPLTRMDLRYDYQSTNPPLGRNNDVNIITLRLDKPFELSPKWKITTRLDLPFMITNRPGNDNKKGNMHFGFSDALVQSLLVHVPSEHFAWAAGAQIIFPTATEDVMGTGKYRVVPTAITRWATNDMLKGSWVALVARWDKDFAEARSNSGSVNEVQFAPLVNIPLPDKWFINLFPSTDIRYNLGDKRAGDSGRWFVPANALVGKMWGKSVVNTLELGVPIIDDYKVYDFKAQFRVGFFF